MDIIQKGVMRSGNVLLRLLLNHIFNDLNISPHTYRFYQRNGQTIPTDQGLYTDPGMHGYEDLKRNNILITPWRDPRDAMISLIRTEYSKATTKISKPLFVNSTDEIQVNNFPSIEYILKNCEKTAKEQIISFKEITKMQSQLHKENILEIKYENFHNNFDYLFNKLEVFFNNLFKYSSIKLKIPIKTREHLKKDFSKKETINYQKTVGPNFDSFCTISHVHGEHVWKGDNKWKEILTPEILDIINPILDPYIKRWESL